MEIIKKALQNYKLELDIREELNEETHSEIHELLDTEIEKFKLITDTNNPKSEISQFNQSIVQYKGSDGFFEYLKDAIYWFGATDGVFNPFAIVIEKSFTNIMNGEWKDEKLFKIDKIDFDFPKDISEVGEFLDIDYANNLIHIQRKTYLDISGISKGIFIDKLAKKLKSMIKSFSIKFGGDSLYICVDDEPWEIEIDNPVLESEEKEIKLEVSNQAVSLSGFIGQKNVIENMNEYLLLDPKAENKLSTDIALIIIKSNNSITSDVLAKSFIISNKKERQNLQKKFPNISRIEIDKDGKVVIIN